MNPFELFFENPNHSNPNLGYVLTALAFPGAIFWLGVIFALTQCFPKHWRWKRWRTVNVIGALMQGSFNVTLGSKSCWLIFDY